MGTGWIYGPHAAMGSCGCTVHFGTVGAAFITQEAESGLQWEQQLPKTESVAWNDQTQGEQHP